MYNVTPTFLTKVKEASRTIKARLNINGTVLDENNIINFTVESSMGSDKLPTIGGTVATKLTVSLVNNGTVPAILIGVPITPAVAIEVSTGVYEWVTLGIFYAETGDVKKTDKVVDIDCFDIMPTLDATTYGSAITYPATIQAMIADISTSYGVVFETQTLPSVSFPVAPIGTVRQVISQIASLTSTNAIMNKDGKMEFRFTNTIAPATFTFDGNNYIDFRLLTATSAKISQLTAVLDDNSELISGDNTGLNVKFQNSAILTQPELDTVFARVYPLTFFSYSMKCQGFPHLSIGDIIQFTDTKSVVRNIIIASNKFMYNGGMISEFGCEAVKGETKEVVMTGGSTVGTSIANFSKTMEQAILNATNQLTGQEGGTVKFVLGDNGKPYEILIMDNENINEAHEIWKWNAGGLGHTSDGYTGLFDTAITANGEIVADFITTGTLNANIIKSGKLKSVNGMAEIDMLTGAFQFGGAGMKFSDAGLIIEQGTVTGEETGIIIGDARESLNKVGTISNIVVTKSTDNITFTSATLEIDYTVVEEGSIVYIENITPTPYYYKVSYTFVTTLLQSLNSKASGDSLVDMNNYMVFDPASGLTLGDQDTTTKVNISDTGINFINNGVIVAYITGQKLNIYTAEIIDSLILGNFAFTPRTNGNLSFGKRV